MMGQLLPSDVGMPAVRSLKDLKVVNNRAKMAVLARAGATQTQAAEELGTSRASVARMERATGVTFRRDNYTGLRSDLSDVVYEDAVLIDPEDLRQRAYDMKPLDAVNYLIGILEGLTHRLPDMTLKPWPGMRLSKVEARLLHHLDIRGGRVCTREAIMTALYHSEPGDWPDIKIVDMFVCKLRKKLVQTPFTIETVWGVGYRLLGAGSDNSRLDWRA
jgi:hypothetical protein